MSKTAMTQLELKNHQVWRDLTEILENLDANALVREHLNECNNKVIGYWDEQDEYYEEIILPLSLEALLISSSIGVTHRERFLKLKFILNTSSVDVVDKDINKTLRIGELLLVYNENLEFIDENWLLDIDSPFLEVKR
jgi:hypothetical protein